MIDFYARRCRSCRRRAAVQQQCFRLTRRALRAHRFGGCSPAHRGDALLSTRSDPRRSTTGTIARLRPLGRELARAEQLPPPRPPAPKPPHPPSSCANVTRSRLAVCKNEKNEDSEKAGSCHSPPGHFVTYSMAIRSLPRTTRTTAPALFQDEIAALALQYGQYGRLAARNGGAGKIFTVFCTLHAPCVALTRWATSWTGLRVSRDACSRAQAHTSRSRSRSMHLHGYSSAFPRIRTN